MTGRIGPGLCAVALAAVLAACSQFPELDAAEPARGGPVEYPRLVPVEPILARADQIGTTPETTDTLAARAAALRRKAAALRAQSF